MGVTVLYLHKKRCYRFLNDEGEMKDDNGYSIYLAR